MKIRLLIYRSYNELPSGEEGIRALEEIINSRIKKIEAQERSRAVRLVPLAEHTDSGYIMRPTVSSDGKKLDVYFSAAVELE
jgi:hypothetical protein